MEKKQLSVRITSHLLLVSAFDSDKAVNIYLGGDQENYVKIVIKSGSIKEGLNVRSEDASFSTDGLEGSAKWKNVNYFAMIFLPGDAHIVGAP